MSIPIHLAISLNKCDSGGQKSLVFAYLRSFDQKRIKFDLIVDSDSNSIPYDDVKKLGGTLHVIPPYQHIVAHLKALKKIFSENKYDVLYAVNNTMNLFPLFMAYRAGIKVRVSESLTMASPLERKKTMMKNVLKRFSHCFCNYMMANGKDCGIYQFGKKAFDQGKVQVFLTPVNAKENTFDPELREKTRKNLKNASLLVLLFVGLTLLQVVTELLFGDLNNAQVPEGAPENIVMITKVFLLVFSLVLLLPKIYVGLKGLRVAKKPDASKKHIVWAMIIFGISALGLIEPVVGIINQGGIKEHASVLFGVLLELVIYYDYIKYAKEVSKLSE